MAKEKFTFISTSALKTKRLAEQLASFLKAGDVLLFTGGLGAGKTTFVQGLVKGLKINGDTVSPTFVIAQTHEGMIPLHHLDFYRLSKKDIPRLGVQDYLEGGGEIPRGVVAIEWADKCPGMWPKAHLEIALKVGREENTRLITIRGVGDRYAQMVKSLKRKRA